MNANTINPTAFDAFADDYDDNFTQSILGRLLRLRVWQTFNKHFTAGQHVLELACGTGEDATWLAKQGVYVTATDGSLKMVEATKTKSEMLGVSKWVKAKQVSLQQVANDFFCKNSATSFDGVYSNFGSLNTIGDWRPLAESLAKIVKPAGKVILVPMGPFCPWEIVWYLGHGQPKVAFRRFGRRTSAQIGEAVIPIWYPSAKRLQTDFAPWFDHVQTESLGLWLPPSYLDHFVKRWPRFFAQLNQFEQTTSRLTKSWGDHCIITFQKRD